MCLYEYQIRCIVKQNRFESTKNVETANFTLKMSFCLTKTEPFRKYITRPEIHGQSAYM